LAKQKALVPVLVLDTNIDLNFLYILVFYRHHRTFDDFHSRRHFWHIGVILNMINWTRHQEFTFAFDALTEKHQLQQILWQLVCNMNETVLMKSTTHTINYHRRLVIVDPFLSFNGAPPPPRLFPHIHASSSASVGNWRPRLGIY
jgi:hypothetical protein